VIFQSKDSQQRQCSIPPFYGDIRLDEGRQCILVLMGATADGYGESERSWKEPLLDCKARGLEIEPSLAIGDGALGFWKAMRQVWDETLEQRCWVHRMANVLDKLPKGSQAKAKGMLHEIYLAETKEADGGQEVIRLVRGDVRGEVPEGDGVPGEGSRGVADVLRLSGGALGAHPDDQPDRERVRDGAAEARQDEGEWEPGGVPGDGLQADGVGIKGLAIVGRFAAAGRGHQGNGLHRRHPG
jgi:Transposase, Mutator family